MGRLANTDHEPRLIRQESGSNRWRHSVANDSPPSDTVELFRSLFRGGLRVGTREGPVMLPLARMNAYGASEGRRRSSAGPRAGVLPARAWTSIIRSQRRMNSLIMKIEIVFVTLLTGLPAMAQTGQSVLEDFQPSTLNQPGQQYPQVNSQRHARFRIVAPQAQNVHVSLGGLQRGGFSLAKGEDGVWTGVTQKPLDEGFHYYHLTVDGGTFNDPGTLNFFGSTRWESGIEIPAEDQDFYALKDVPHGQVQQILFFSKSTGTSRRAFVYTPPGYDQGTTRRYPVLYLQHGWGEDETAWSNQGRVNLIMDNLIALNRSKPFIIVMTYGMTNDIRFGGLRNFDIGPFQTVLVDELIPYIDSHFRTLPEQPNRAMAGLSMGGMETRMITLKNLDKFSHIGLFSGGVITPEDVENTGGFRERVKVVFCSCGSRENPDRIQANHEALKAAGIANTAYVSPETAHEFLTWRRSMREFAPLLFLE